MIYKVFLSVVIITLVGVVQIHAQVDCIPLPVENITISHDAVLSWQLNANEICDVIYYLVYIDSSVNTEYVYAVAFTNLAVRFLPVCDDYVFRIVAVSADNLDSRETRLATKIPLPANANLTVAFLKITGLEGESVLLEWSLEEDWAKCPDRYRVVIDDQDLDLLQDVYTYSTSIEIPSLAPCTSYEFGVIAIYNWEIEGPITVVQYEAPPQEINPPILQRLTQGSTFANITWQLEPYARNKCAVTSTEIRVRDVSSNFNMTVSVADQPERQPLTITLSNLRPDNLYFVNTTIINVVGPSTPVILVVQTRP